MKDQTLHFPHVISANSVQESARLIQEIYKNKTGHKLKRSFLLEGLSHALKYSNKKVMEANQGKASIHKEIPIYLGSSFYSIVGSYECKKPQLFYGTSETEVLKKISDHLIDNYWEILSLYCMSNFTQNILLNDNLKSILENATHRIFHGTPFEGNPDLIMSGDFTDDVRFNDVGQLIASRLSKIEAFRETIFDTLVNDCDCIEGEHIIEVMSDGNLPILNSYLPCVEQAQNDEKHVNLKGLIAVDPSLLAYPQDIVESFLFGLDRQLISETLAPDNYGFSYEIAHNHGRTLENAANSVAIYVTLSVKEDALTEPVIATFLSNSL